VAAESACPCPEVEVALDSLAAGSVVVPPEEARAGSAGDTPEVPSARGPSATLAGRPGGMTVRLALCFTVSAPRRPACGGAGGRGDSTIVFLTPITVATPRNGFEHPPAADESTTTSTRLP
jgi:hypothetical protein